MITNYTNISLTPISYTNKPIAKKSKDDLKQESISAEPPDFSYIPPIIIKENAPPPPSPDIKTTALDEYKRRPQYQYSIEKEKDKNRCKERIMNALENGMLKKFNIDPEELDRDIAAFYSGLYYYDYWTGGPSRIPNRKKDLAEIAAKRAARSNMIRNFTSLSQEDKIKLCMTSSKVPNSPNYESDTLVIFDGPYRTVYDSEQAMKYYLSLNPQQSANATMALITIGQCRIQQKDYIEAKISFKFAIRTAMNNAGFDNQNAAEDLSSKMMEIYKKNPDKVRLTMNISASSPVNLMGIDPNKAVENIINQNLELNKNNPDNMINTALNLSETGQIDYTQWAIKYDERSNNMTIYIKYNSAF